MRFEWGGSEVLSDGSLVADNRFYQETTHNQETNHPEVLCIMSNNWS
jgi:hypothetical protein